MRSIGFMLGCFLLLVGPASSKAQVPPSLPVDFRQALQLIPANAESLVATLTPFVVDKFKQDNGPRPPHILTFNSVLGFSVSEQLIPAFAEIAGKGALWGIFSKRDQEFRAAPNGIIDLGIHPYESITIVKFREALPIELTQALRRISSVRSLRTGGDVFRFRNAAAAALLPQPDVLMLVTMLTTSDAMLDDLVRRIEDPAGSVLFDDVPLAWSLSELSAPIWAIRRTKDAHGRSTDEKGRDWVLFSYDPAVPGHAHFRNVKAGSPWRGQTRELSVNTWTTGAPGVESGGGYTDLFIDCRPDNDDDFGYLWFGLIYEAMGLVVWI